MAIYVILTAVLVGVCDLSFAYQSGAPDSICESMYPNHGVGPQQTPSPYTISTDKGVVKPGDDVTVYVRAPSVPFKGLVLQARDDQNNIVGYFNRVPGFKLLDCQQGKENAATHTGNDPKKEMSISWNSPRDIAKPFYFVMTVVQDRSTFWVGQRTNFINVIAA